MRFWELSDAPFSGGASGFETRSGLGTPCVGAGAALCHKDVILRSRRNLTGEKDLPTRPWHGSSGLILQEAPVPTLFRFLLVVAILAGLGFAAMFALATFVKPDPREITVPVPTTRTTSSS